MSSIKEFISHDSNCGKNTTFIENRINHILHAILSIFLLETWLIVWLYLIIFKDKKTQCKVCGTPPVKDQKLDNIAKKKFHCNKYDCNSNSWYRTSYNFGINWNRGKL